MIFPEGELLKGTLSPHLYESETLSNLVPLVLNNSLSLVEVFKEAFTSKLSPALKLRASTMVNLPGSASAP